jgi:predicted DNA-binding protein
MVTRGTPTLTIRLDVGRRSRLEAIAQRRGLTRADVIREAIERMLAEAERDIAAA